MAGGLTLYRGIGRSLIFELLGAAPRMGFDFEIIREGDGPDSSGSARGLATPDPERRPPIARLAVLGFAILGILMVASALGFSAWRSKMTGPKPSSSWAVASQREVAKTVAATGAVRLKTGSTVRIGSQLSGIVERLNVTVGAHVSRGSVIAEIDPRPVQAKIDQMRAQVARNVVIAAKAKADLKRATALAESGWMSGQSFDDAKSNAATTEAALAVSREDLKAASVDLNYVKIRAPISGVVASVSTQTGETVAASFATPTFVTIIQPDALEVIALVDEADIGDVRIGQPAEFTVESWPDRDFRGHVERIAPVSTVISGVINYEVAIRIDSDLAGLRPDMTANVTITTARASAVSVPAGALRRTSAGTMVAVRSKDGLPVLRRVRADQPRSGTADIRSGLRAGEQVLVETGASK